MTSRKKAIIVAFGAMAVGYVFLPSYFGLTDAQTDVVFSILLALGLGTLAYEDHRATKEAHGLLAAITACCLVVLSLSVAVLLTGIQFHALIPLIAVCGGVLYWYVDRHIRSRVEQGKDT